MDKGRATVEYGTVHAASGKPEVLEVYWAVIDLPAMFGFHAIEEL